MRAHGANHKDLKDFVQQSTSHYNQVFASANPDKTDFKSYSPESKLIFLNNRQHHTNNVNG